jgi:NNP family nitrate/nitrite transporter-like MFS transporter
MTQPVDPKAASFRKSGHLPTLLCAFLYFDFCFAIWVLNGAMAPFIRADLGLTPVEVGFMVSVPIISGALIRFPLGLLAQYIGRKNAAQLEMGTIVAALLYGYFLADTYGEVLVMGAMLGIAGASFGVALSLGGGWYPPRHKGLAIGIAGAGNSGAVISVLLAPPLAAAYGWQSVYGLAVLLMMVPMVLMAVFAREPPDREKKSLKTYLKVVVEKDAWVFNISYILTFGGYIGLTNFLPTFFHNQYGIPKTEVGHYSAIIIIMASLSRIAGGWLADRFGGINVMMAVCGVVVVAALAASALPPVMVMTAILIVLFLALGTGNGATFQLVPFRWPATTAIAMSLIGQVGALGGGLMPNVMGASQQYYGTFSYGFLLWAGLAMGILALYLVAQRTWTMLWVGKGGKALSPGKRLRGVEGGE